MWPYVFLLFRRQPGKSALASSGFLLAACALILLSATTQTTVVQANKVISQNWRPTYDLVVLPPQTKISSDQNIPPDLLGGYAGGISLQQYEQIKQIPGIEVAAPIAYVGYIRMPIPSFHFSNQSLPAGYYQMDWTLTAFNGQRNIVEAQESTYIYLEPFPNCLDSQHSTYSKVSVALTMFEGGCTSQDGLSPSFSPPDTGTFLLAAVDPTAENQLVHLDKSISGGRMLTEQDTIHLDQRVPHNPVYSNYLHKYLPIDAIPLLIDQQIPGQTTLNGTFTLLYDGSMTPEQILAKGGLAYLQQRSNTQAIFHGAVPLVQNDPQRFSGADLQWNGHTWQAIHLKGIDANYYLDFSTSYIPAGLTYQPATAPDGSPAYTLVPTGTQGPEVAFRDLIPLHTLKSADPAKPDVVYNYEAVGQFSGRNLAAQLGNPLNWLPENTYTAPAVVLRYDAQGHAITPTPLIPTTNSAGYVAQPPLALTTLAAAVQLKGDHVISAIRVRVAGVDQANQESWKRIQQVAGLIRQVTYLPVQVTLGSSPRPTLVFVPGVKHGQLGATQTIDPVGWVEEPWIAIGVSIRYLAQLGAIRLLLVAAVLAVCLGYLVVAFSALLNAQRREFAVLSALGWRPWHPARLFLTQALFFALGGGIMGIGLALLIITSLEAIPLWPIVVWTLPTMLGMALISSLYPLWQIWHIQPAEILRAGSSVTSTRSTLVSLPLWSIGMLVVRNLMRSRPRTVMTISSLFLSAILLVLMLSSVLELHQALMGTLVGNFVLLQTAIPQIAGCVFAVLLTFLSVADLLLLQVRERQREIGLFQAIGWRPGLVKRLFVQEGLTLAVIGAVPGALVALGVLVAQHTVQSIVTPLLVALGATLLMLLVAGLATLPALRVMNRMQVVDVLRAE